MIRSDCHMHMILDGVEWRSAIARHAERPNDGFIHEILSRYQALGYTYLRDGGDRWGAGARAKELAPQYGITYRTPLAPLCKAGHYGAFIGKKYSNFREYLELVRDARRDGADFIKIMISGLMDFDQCGRLTEEGMPPEEIRELIRIAHGEGFAVMAHCNGARTAQAAAEAGVDSVEHGAYYDDDTLAALLENGTVWVPTISTVANLRGKGRFNEEAVRGIFASTAENLRKFANLGGIIAPGSDAGAWAVTHGCESEVPLLRQILGENADAILEHGAAAIRAKF